MLSSTVVPLPEVEPHQRYRAAIEARDAPAVNALLAPHVLFRSPATSTPFVGSDAVSELLTIVIRSFERVSFQDAMSEGDTLVLAGYVVMFGRYVDVVNVVRFDDHGRIRELYVYSRPLGAASNFVRAVAPGLAARRSAPRRALVWLLARPIPSIIRTTDRFLMRLIDFPTER